MSRAFTPHGPGDEATWGPCMGHPLDPRTPEPCDCGGCNRSDGCCECAACPDCRNGSCRGCVDRFIRDFTTAPYPAQWLREQGCDPIRDEDGDETVNEALQRMASLYVQGQVAGKAFFRVMQKMSAQAEENRKLMASAGRKG